MFSSRQAVVPPNVLVPSKPARRRKRLRILSPLISTTVIASALLFSVSRAYDPAPAQTYPLGKTLEAPTDRELILLGANGKPFARRGGCFDTPVTVDEIPGHFVDALLATEDRRFYSHFGIDPIGVLRAAQSNYHAGKVVQGGSTITQQLAKISYLSSEKSFERKVKEGIAVLRLESALTKDEILERYLSRAYFGEGCFGLRAAARYYFNRKVVDLTIPESAMLVALLKSPTQLSQDRAALRQRENLVMNAMVEFGRLDAGKRQQMKPAGKRSVKATAFGAYYADWVADTVQLPADGSEGALPVRTGFEPKLQRAAERAVATILKHAGRGRKASQAALVAMRPDGRVVAMVGGVNYRKSQFNRASQALRQPGSSFKAFVYLAAMRAGGRPDMLVIDEPITIGDWSPKNYSKSYQGIVPLIRAFSYSINTVSVRLTQALGPAKVAAAARDLGISTPISSKDPSIALGTNEVTLLDLTSAYAAFAADAYPVKPWGVVSLGDERKGYGRPPEGAGQWKLMEGASMRQFLETTVQAGTGRAARLPIRSYGKTGTSQNYRDAWFIGFAGNLVVGVWVGNDDNSPMNRVTGGSLPAQIWKNFMSKARYVDRKFKSRLPKITAFRAVPPYRKKNKVVTAALQSILVNQGQRYAQNGRGTNPFGNAMLFGSPRGAWGIPAGQGYGNYRNNPASNRRQFRTRKAWNPFETQ